VCPSLMESVPLSRREGYALAVPLWGTHWPCPLAVAEEVQAVDLPMPGEAVARAGRELLAIASVATRRRRHANLGAEAAEREVMGKLHAAAKARCPSR